jgi:hypothetical protein
VIKTRDAQSFTRSRSDSAEKTAKTTLWIAPMRAREERDGGVLRHREVERAGVPFLTPNLEARTFASEHTSRSSSA